MEKRPSASEARAQKRILSELDNRMGNVLFIGARVPDIAAHLASRGLFVTVVESDPTRLQAFLEHMKSAGLEQSMSVDLRPYPSISFEGSSYNVVVAWEGTPDGMLPDEFFKKVRRELKAGSNLYLRTALRPALPSSQGLLRKVASRLPERVVSAGEGVSERILSMLIDPDAPDRSALVEAADRFLVVENIEVLSVLPPPVARLAGVASGLGHFAAGVPMVIDLLDARLVGLGAVASLATSALLRCSKSREFGRIFRV